MEAGAALVRALIDAGIDTAFTVPGESFLAVLEALRLNRNRVRLISVRQEGGGTLAAHGYGQSRNFPAAVFVSRGPGATNAAIGVHAAHQDSVPLILFIGQVRSHMKGREAFQEIDPHSAFESMAKAVLEPRTADELPATARRAVEISVDGRPGPVVVVMPRDFGETDVEALDQAKSVSRIQYSADLSVLQELKGVLNAAKRPVILAGELARSIEARHALGVFAHQISAPVLCAYRCQDVLDNDDPNYAGHLEINPVPYQKDLIEKSDLIVVAGSRLDGITSREETLIPSATTWAHVHPDQTVLDRFSADYQIRADIGTALDELTAILGHAPSDRDAWRQAAHDAFVKFSTPGDYPVHGLVDLSIVAAEARDMLPDDAVVATDGGSYARWIHRYFRFKGPSTQGGTASGAMGAGVPGAIGAALAAIDGQPVVAFCGDGGFMMSGQELTTASRENIPIKIIVCDNNVHGSILKGQLDKYGDEHAFGTIMGSPDFAKVAEGYGVANWTVRTTKEWKPAFAAALAHDGPALVHVLTDPHDIAPYGAEKDAV